MPSISSLYFLKESKCVHFPKSWTFLSLCLHSSATYILFMSCTSLNLLSWIFLLLHQSQQQSHSQMVSSLTAQLRDTQQELREKEKQKKEADRAWQNNREDREREERKLRASLEKRDKLIEVKSRNLFGLQKNVMHARQQGTNQPC